MAHIDINAIMGKVKSFTNTAEGKKRMSQYLRDCRENGRSQTASGENIVTEQEMIRAAETIISMLKETAAQHKLPESVREHFNSLYYNQPIPWGKQGEKYKVDITFGDDLSRMSLLITSGKNKGKRTGDGIKNIVSLFDTGYDASKQVYGQWDGHVDVYAWNDTIASKTHRDGLNFMQETLDAFNRKYGTLYNVVAIISAEDQSFYASGRDLGDGMIL